MKSENENTFLIPRSKLPSGQNIMYANPVCDYLPQKDDPYCIILKICNWQYSLPLILRFSCLNPIGDKHSFQQRCFNPWFTIYLIRYQGLISLLTHGILRIYQNAFLLDPQRNKDPVKFILYCGTWRLHILWSKKRYVWTKTNGSSLFW